MATGRLKVKDKILVFILPVIIIALFAITFLGDRFAKQLFIDEYKNQKNLVEAHVINAVNLIDPGFRMLEINIEAEMGKKILEFKDEFEKAGGDPEKVSLEALKLKMGEKFDLMIVDSGTTIIKTTVPQGLNFNFMQFDKVLGEEINKIRLSTDIRHERIRTNAAIQFDPQIAQLFVEKVLSNELL